MAQDWNKTRFFMARRDTRWDPYPQAEPLAVVKLDWEGFYVWIAPVGWVKSPTSFCCQRELTEAEAERAVAQ